jgi:hypothetical protein
VSEKSDTDTTIFGVRKTDTDTDSYLFWCRYVDPDNDTDTDNGYFGVSGKFSPEPPGAYLGVHKIVGSFDVRSKVKNEEYIMVVS